MTITEENRWKAGRPTVYDHRSIVQALADGKKVCDLAAEIGRPYRGLQEYIYRLQRKYGLKSQCHLVAHYLRNGWVD